jgi:hypothetical protein
MLIPRRLVLASTGMAALWPLAIFWFSERSERSSA